MVWSLKKYFINCYDNFFLKKIFFCVKYLGVFIWCQYMSLMAADFTKKNELKYSCEYCDFNTCKKTDYTRHISTQKHKINILSTPGNTKNEISYICSYCEKEYSDRTGLWKHKKKCNLSMVENSNTLNEPTDKELIMMLIKQNTQLIEQNAELVKNGINNTTNSHNNTNSLNKTFNLQFFLNETCKDAMNIMDFVDSIQLQLSDLEKVGEDGYVKGISNIITSNLKALDVTQRPIHCTDKKREVLYIKDENKWEKEGDDKNKIRKAIKSVTIKNQRLIPKFKEAHPDCGKSDSAFSNQYNNIIIESMGGSNYNSKEDEEKIIKNITNSVVINKELY